jgi:hypothetical protein
MLETPTGLLRLQGTAIWIELEEGKTLDKDDIERTIAKPRLLNMDMRRGRGEYVFEPAADGQHRLYGAWGQGTVMWAGGLHEVAVFDKHEA